MQTRHPKPEALNAWIEAAALTLVGALVMAFIHGEGSVTRALTRRDAPITTRVADYARDQVAYFLDRDRDRGVPGHDSYYHIKMAAMLPEHGLVDEFPWLRFVYFTREGADFVSHHYGFHALMVPFVYASKAITGDYLAGGRWATAFFFGLVLAAFNALLRQAGIRHRGLWLLLFFGLPDQFFSRHSYVRAISPSLAFMLAICWLAFANRYILLGIAVALYTHLYLGAVMYSPVIVAAFALARVLGPGGWRRFPVAVVLCGIAGWAAGALTYPYFEGMAEFLRLQVLGSGLNPDIEVGREWRPYEGVWFFAMMSGVVLATWAAALVLRAGRGPRLDARAMTFLILHFAFLLLTMKARRFVEYWPVFCLLSAATLAGLRVDRWLDWLLGAGPEPAGRGHPPPVAASAKSAAAPSIPMREPTDWFNIVFSWVVLGGLVYLAARSAKVRELALAWPLWAALIVYGALSLVRNIRRPGGLPGALPHLARDLPIAMGAVCIVAVAASTMWLGIRNGARSIYQPRAIASMMDFLKAESNAGDVIFTSDWDDFPVFFYYNSHNHYIVGLDPKFTHARRPDLWERYVRLSRGQVPRTSQVTSYDEKGRKTVDDIRVELPDIRTHFGARYAITDRDHKAMALKLARAPDVAELVYPAGRYEDVKDAPYLVFRIKDAGETPPASSRPAAPASRPDAGDRGNVPLDAPRPIPTTAPRSDE